jgi:Restriction endonuclease BsobI
MTYKNHLQSVADLRTSQVETRAGFVAMALEKSKQASPYVDQARSLALKMKTVSDPLSLIMNLEVRAAMVAAAGLSDKAVGHIGEDGCLDAITQFVEEFLIPAGKEFGDEVVYRFLLTRGDTLGGAMRNIVGAIAQRKLNSAIVADLKVAGKSFHWLNKSAKTWVLAAPNAVSNVDEIANAAGLSWVNPNNESRCLMYNIKVPIVGNNVDFCLFKFDHQSFAQGQKAIMAAKAIIAAPESYVALGELKGIDPAGADEHWKTAKSALTRIRSAFKSRNSNPHIVFVGAAIEANMATEIWNELETGLLANAANLTKQSHVTSVCNWMTQL